MERGGLKVQCSLVQYPNSSFFSTNLVLIPDRHSKEVILEACKMISDFYTAGGNEQQ